MVCLLDYVQLYLRFPPGHETLKLDSYTWSATKLLQTTTQLFQGAHILMEEILMGETRRNPLELATTCCKQQQSQRSLPSNGINGKY